MTNKKQSSTELASAAGSILSDQNASGIQKTLAASVLSQSNSTNQTGADMESIASNVLTSTKYNDTTKSLAGSVLSQANKDR